MILFILWEILYGETNRLFRHLLERMKSGHLYGMEKNTVGR